MFKYANTFTCKSIIFFMLILTSMICYSTNYNANNTSMNYIYEKLKSKKSLHDFNDFVKKMPKGADLHTHFSGAINPEELILLAQKTSNRYSWCILPQKGYEVIDDKKCETKNGFLLKHLKQNSPRFKKIVEQWSTIYLKLSPPYFGHDHFFSVFSKISKLVSNSEIQVGVLKSLMETASQHNTFYLELMLSPDILFDENPTNFVGKISPDKHAFHVSRSSLRTAVNHLNTLGFIEYVQKNIVYKSSEMLRKARLQLNCNKRKSSRACNVHVKFQYAVYRAAPLYEVFTNSYAACIASNIAETDFVGINFVGKEDDVISVNDYKNQMLMLKIMRDLSEEIFHQRKPSFPYLSLHAGELVKSFLEKEDEKLNNLNFHIDDAVNTAMTDRIGHGTDLYHELKTNKGLVKNLINKNILVETNLTSNQIILGVNDPAKVAIAGLKNKTQVYKHPFYTYLKQGVPVALSTDDAGILNTNLSNEYKRASLRYPINYQDLKNMDRNSLSYSFLPGQSIWKKSYHGALKWNYNQMINACKSDNPYSNRRVSKSCRRFLKQNKKAQLQWNLEEAFAKFEHSYLK